MYSLFDHTPDDNGADGEALKQHAHAILEATRKAIVRDARRALLEHALLHGTATIDDVRALVPIPPGINPKVFGAVPGPLAKAGSIRAVGFKRTDRNVAHARILTIWAIADTAKATAQLTALRTA